MYKLPELKYGYADLEPYIDEETMRLHHTKHHQGYIDKLNGVLEKAPEFQSRDIEDLMFDLDSVPEMIRTTVRNNGGGHLNHNLWWETIGPVGAGSQEPDGALAESVNNEFGSFGHFCLALKDKAGNHFGSGWIFLVSDSDGKLSIVSTDNQDTPISQGLTPLLNIDVWEHAYYLKYQNRRADYLEAVISILNWKNISQRFLK